MGLSWKKSVLSEIDGMYCLEPFFMDGRLKIAAASEIHDGVCKIIDFESGEEETVWTGPGGCLNVCPLPSGHELVAGQNFYKGGQAQDARVVEASGDEDGWKVRVLASVPFFHRSGVAYVQNVPYVIACTLCESRKCAGDWSHPGKIYLFKIPEEGSEADISILRENVVKNHGFWQGTFDGEEVFLIGGTELYRIKVPEKEDDPWDVDVVISREFGDVAVQDIDSDGQDELFVFEGLHGNEGAIYKRIGGEWEKIYSCPMKFAHAIWGGELLGRPTFVGGSMEGEQELYILQPEETGGKAEIKRTVLEKGVCPSNCRGLVYKGRSYVLAAAREAGQLVCFELEDE